MLFKYERNVTLCTSICKAPGNCEESQAPNGEVTYAHLRMNKSMNDWMNESPKSVLFNEH